MNVLFIIPARGGSKGIPRKNIRSLAGSPLISYSIKNALSVKYDSDVYVSSEDDEILNIAHKYGAKQHKREEGLAGDEITLDSVIFDAYQAAKANENKEYDLIITLQPTSPLLKSSSIEEAISKMVNNTAIETVISAKEDTHLSWREENGKFLPNYTKRLNRQFLTPNYTETGGFLICRSDIITAQSRIGQNVSLHLLNSKETIDIDTYEDWSICEYYLKKKRIIFLVSGHNDIGLGHIYNTLIIANEILDHDVLFFCDKKSDLGYKKIKENNYPCIIQSTSDLQQEVIDLNPDIVINDRLDTSVSDINKFIEEGVKLIHFEDLGDGAKKADLVFNAIYPETEKLENHYFGAQYFCARDEFILSPVKEIKKEVNTVLIAFGGVDPNNLTLKVIEAIYEYCQKFNIEIKVITGFGYKHLDGLEQFEAITIYKNVKNISSHMLEADLVFTSAGRTTYELAILGVPSIVLAQNDRELTHFFATEKYGFLNLGLGINVKENTILKSFIDLMEVGKRELMQQKMLKHDLKNGKLRVVSIIKNFINNTIL